MELISEDWRLNQNADLRAPNFFRIEFSLTDPAAQADADIEDNDHAPFSISAEINEKYQLPVYACASFEPGLWDTTGRFVLPPETPGKYGLRYWTDTLCDTAGIFTLYPTITITFTSHHLSAGIPLTFSTFYDEYAKDFQFIAFSDSLELVNLDIVDNDEIEFNVSEPLENYNKIVILIKRWSTPLRRARIERIKWGFEYLWERSDIIDYTRDDVSSVLSHELPRTIINYALDDVARKFNWQNPEGIARFIMEQQKVKQEMGYLLNNAIEWISLGTSYLTQWNLPSNNIEARFTAESLLGIMTDVYYKGKYSPTGRSLYDLALDILSDLRPSLAMELEYDLDDSLKYLTTTAPMPMLPQNQCLQLIANAACCTIGVDRNNRLFIRPLSGYQHNRTIQQGHCYNQPALKLTKPLKQVDVNSYSYVTESTQSEIFSGEYEIFGTKTLQIMYTSPATNQSTLVVSGTLLNAQYFTYGCLLTISGNGLTTIIITGTRINQSNTVISLDMLIDNGYTETISNPLITSIERAAVVGEWASIPLKSRLRYAADYRGFQEVDALDAMWLKTRFDSPDYPNGAYPVIIDRHKLTYNGAWRGSFEAMGSENIVHFSPQNILVMGMSYAGNDYRTQTLSRGR